MHYLLLKKSIIENNILSHINLYIYLKMKDDSLIINQNYNLQNNITLEKNKQLKLEFI